MVSIVIADWLALPLLAAVDALLAVGKPTGEDRTDAVKRYWLVVLFVRLTGGLVGIGWLASTQMFDGLGWIGAAASMGIALVLMVLIHLRNYTHQAGGVAGVVQR